MAHDLETDRDQTRPTFFDELEGHGFGKPVVGLAPRSARE
jgi:hypothetical protein